MVRKFGRLMLSHRGTEEIKTDRLTLRKYELKDALDVYNNYGTDERVTKFLSWKPYESIEDLNCFIETLISSYNDSEYDWIIEFKGEAIGSISVVRMDESNESCEIGYCLAYNYWGMGITTEAMNAVLRYLFKEVGFNSIVAKHDIKNPASGRVMQKCGMSFEGKLRKHYKRSDRTFSDSLMYSILKDEFINV